MQDVQQIVDENGYQFFCCYKCGELISAIELAYALNTTGLGCRCGCMKVQPVQVKVEQYSRRNVVEMAIWQHFNEADYIADFIIESDKVKMNPEDQAGHIAQIHKLYSELLPQCEQ